MSKESISGDLDPNTVAAIGAVANSDNWRGLDDAGKKRLQAEIDKGLTKEQKRTVDAIVAKARKRRG